MVPEAWNELMRVLENILVHHSVPPRYLTKAELWEVLVALYEIGIEVTHAET